MKSSTLPLNTKQSASFGIVLSIVTIVTLWLMLVAPDTSANAQATSSPGDWIEFHRDNMQRWNPYETVLDVNNVGGLQLKWKNPIGSYLTLFQSSPAVVNEVVYFGSDDGNVYALDASTGAKLWSNPTGPVSSSPAVVNGVLYVGSSDHIYALNASNGAKLWSYNTGSSVLSSPAVADSVVYIGSSSAVLALNAGTGALLWEFPIVNGVFSSPAVANGVVYVGGEDLNFYALDASTGAKLWSYTAGNVESSPAVSNGVVYFGSDDDKVYALNASTGAKLWNYTTGYFVESSPAVANGVVYVGSADLNVYALDASTGAKLWSLHTASSVETSPAVANGVLYIGDDIGNVYALKAATGAKLWSFSAGTNVFGTPALAVANGVLYTRMGDRSSGKGNVYAFSLSLGTGNADLFLRIMPSATTIHTGDELTFAFPVWNLGPNNADFEELNTQVPAGTVFDYVRISGTPGLGTCTHPPYGGTGQIICHEGDGMAPNTTWTVRLTVKVTAPACTVITANAATMSDTPDPNLANNTATVSLTVQ